MKIILITSWRRPYYYLKVLDALQRCDGIEDYIILNHVDQFSDKGQELQYEFKKIDESHSIKYKVGRIVTDIAPYPQGNAMAIHRAWKNAFDLINEPDSNDFIIYLEDDDLPSRDWLCYMEWAEKKFRGNPDIFIIEGYNYRRESIIKEQLEQELPLVGVRTPPRTYYGWGMWRYIWDEVKENWFGIHWKDNNEPEIIPEGPQFIDVVRKAHDGSWGWPMLKYWRKGRKVVYPIVSRIQNIGAREGRFNPNSGWHVEHMHTNVWAEDNPSQEYTLIEENIDEDILF